MEQVAEERGLDPAKLNQVRAQSLLKNACGSDGQSYLGGQGEFNNLFTPTKEIRLDYDEIWGRIILQKF